MERALKSQNSSLAVAYPTADGWALRRVDRTQERFSGLDELAATLPAFTRLHLALPVNAVLFHRMVLPTTDDEELAAMIRLQLEKTLPFSSDEITTDFSLIRQGDGDSAVLSYSVRNAELESVCAPLTNRGFHPSRVSVLAAELVAEIVPEEAPCALVVYAETGGVAFAISEGGRLSHAGWAQGKDSASARQNFMEQLPSALLAAELEGIPTGFKRIYLHEDCSDLAPALESFVGVKAELFSGFDANAQSLEYNLMPHGWVEARRAEHRVGIIKQRLKQAGVGYLVLIVGALGFLVSSQLRLSKLEKRLAAIRPDVDSITELKASWSRFAPAVDPERYPVELLLQVSNSLPSPEVRLTKFTCNLEQIILEGEAPTASLAIEFGEQLKKNASLKRYNLEAGPPVLLPNEHAQFRIFGKL